jgi:hypothetical protein
MSHSRTTLNAHFYEWIDEVRRAFRKEKELLGKLEYYNVKFIGYKGINYGQIITNPMPRNDKDMLYWLDKIDETKRRVKVYKKIINEYYLFLEQLNVNEKEILKNFLQTKKWIDNEFKNSELTRIIRIRIKRKWNSHFGTI